MTPIERTQTISVNNVFLLTCEWYGKY